MSVDSTINRAHQHATNVALGLGGTGRSNYKNPRGEPPVHASGGRAATWAPKIHPASDGKGWPPAILVCPDQGRDSAILAYLFAVPGQASGRAGRTRPDRVLGDKAYSVRANRALLRAGGEHRGRLRTRGLTIPAKRRDRRGGRPVSFDTDTYKGRNTLECGFNRLKY
ncbi:hypothetical protein [Kribbella sp. CA-294648]|uniref:hypothetical protein n=1 Tax=Kribbella sp. CA-294648 TaxID=3239948 RepID=UPI003D901413